RLKRRRESPLESDDGESANAFLSSEEPGPDISLVRQERAAMVKDALLKVSEGSRTVLVLRHYEGLKFREIAVVLDIPEGTVKSRMAEGLRQLNHFLQQSAKKEIELWNRR